MAYSNDYSNYNRDSQKSDINHSSNSKSNSNYNSNHNSRSSVIGGSRVRFEDEGCTGQIAQSSVKSASTSDVISQNRVKPASRAGEFTENNVKATTQLRFERPATTTTTTAAMATTAGTATMKRTSLRTKKRNGSDYYDANKSEDQLKISSPLEMSRGGGGARDGGSGKGAWDTSSERVFSLGGGGNPRVPAGGGSSRGVQPRVVMVKVDLIKGEGGFGFVLSDTRGRGEEHVVRHITNPVRCKDMRIGDVLVAVNGSDVQMVSHPDVVALFRERPPGSVTSLTIRRNLDISLASSASSPQQSFIQSLDERQADRLSERDVRQGDRLSMTSTAYSTSNSTIQPPPRASTTQLTKTTPLPSTTATTDDTTSASSIPQRSTYRSLSNSFRFLRRKSGTRSNTRKRRESQNDDPTRSSAETSSICGSINFSGTPDFIPASLYRSPGSVVDVNERLVDSRGVRDSYRSAVSPASKSSAPSVTYCGVYSVQRATTHDGGQQSTAFPISTSDLNNNSVVYRSSADRPKDHTSRRSVHNIATIPSNPYDPRETTRTPSNPHPPSLENNRTPNTRPSSSAQYRAQDTPHKSQQKGSPQSGGMNRPSSAPYGGRRQSSDVAVTPRTTNQDLHTVPQNYGQQTPNDRISQRMNISTSAARRLHFEKVDGQPANLPTNQRQGVEYSNPATYQYQGMDRSNPTTNERRWMEYDVELHRGSRGFGFSIRGGREFTNMPLCVLNIAPGGPADKDGRMENDDQVLVINGVTTVDITHEAAIDLIQNSCSPIKLTLRRPLTSFRTPAGQSNSHK